MRLAKFLASTGAASRRSSELLIQRGFVSVNGKQTKNLATQVNGNDVIRLKGVIIKPQQFVYYILHKPVGYVCSLKDPHQQHLVTDLVPKEPRVVPVGRLDKDSSGLLILTNDGDMVLHLTHPRYQTRKVYEVTLEQPWEPAFAHRLKQGIRLSEGLAKADSVRTLSATRLEITIHQGWKRQLRRMIAEAGNRVLSLCRVAEGTVKLGTLKPGEYRIIKRSDIFP